VLRGKEFVRLSRRGIGGTDSKRATGRREVGRRGRQREDGIEVVKVRKMRVSL
jgi:hypothetical protein